MPSLKEQIEELTRLKHRLAVWETLADYLDQNFISKDGRNALKAIRAPGAHSEIVSEEMIESVLQALGEGPIAELNEQVKAIEDGEITIVSGGTRDGKEG